MNGGSMRIVFDPQGALGGSKYRGIGRYTRSFLREFARIAQHHEIIIVLNTMLPEAFDELRIDLEGLVPFENFVTWSAEAPIGGMHEDNWQRRALAREIWEEKISSLEPDLLIVSSLFEGAEDDAVSSIPVGRDYLVATICYDLIPLIYRQHYLLHPGMEAYYRRQIEQLRSSDFLLAISQSAADEAVQLLRYPLERVINIGAAVDAQFGQAKPLNLNTRFGIVRPYLLYVSAFEVRKNHAGLIRAYASLPPSIRSEHQLVLGGGVGAVQHLRDVAEEAGLASDEIIFSGSVDDPELIALYAQSKAVVFPSWHEGFGLPILEAMMFGKAVISSNRSSMPEVVGLDEALFDPLDEKDMAASIARVLTDGSFRAKLEENAPRRVAAFTWQRSARLALDFLEDGVARRPRPRDYNRRFVANALRRIKSNPALTDFSQATASQHVARSFRRDDRRQLLIDVSRLIVEDAKTGIQRVVRAILASLLKNPPEGWVVEPVHANASELGYRYARSFADRFLGLEHHWHEDRPVEVWSGDILCILDLEPDVLIKQQPVLDEWRKQGVEVYTVVHDILPLMLPEYFPESVGDRIMAKWVSELARHSGAICVSQAVANQLKEWIASNNVPTNARFRYDWFHHGSDIANSMPTRGIPETAKALLASLEQRPSALMVGTLEPRKAHSQALAAFEQLWSKGVDLTLVIVGKLGWRVDRLAERIRQHSEFGKRLFWLESISDEFLEQLYARSSFLLGASEGEGFGLPIIEAARHGLPLVLRDLTVFHEVAGEGAFYFPNERDPQVIADAIERWQELEAAGEHPKPSAVFRHSWSESAQMLVRALTQRSRS
jgi:glycosyltransferase involved in cell wall biosynthesis